MDIQFGRGTYLEKEEPYRTIIAIVKGNTLANFYRKERERLFAYNIRSFLGKRVNKPVVETAATNPLQFFYFNNGVSAIDTKIVELRKDFFPLRQFSNHQWRSDSWVDGSGWLS